MSKGNESPVLDLPDGSLWTDAPFREKLEKDCLPGFLAKARWFPVKLASKIRPRIKAFLPFAGAGREATFLVIVQTGASGFYVLPMRADWPASSHKYRKPIVARLRQGNQEGILHDVAADERFIRRLLHHLRNGGSMDATDWSLAFEPTSKMTAFPDGDLSRVRPIEGEQSNSTSLIDQTYVVKLYRHIEPGRNPEIEMGRFLTEKVDFEYAPALLGHVEAVHGESHYALAVVHAFVPNRGDAWTWSVDRIQIYLDAIRVGSGARDTALTVRRDYLQWVRRMGCRVAEMHLALASRADIDAFEPEPITEIDVAFWLEGLLVRASRVFEDIESQRSGSDLDDSLVKTFLQHREALPRLAKSLLRTCVGRCQIRHHGDLHLGQILVAEDDAVIIDFEGEPKRPMEERRRRAPAARDVAGVIRSLDYAAMAVRSRNEGEDKLPLASLRALMAWRDQSIESFLSGYRDAIGNSALWPESAEHAQAMLDFFLLEKALYEVEYELAYRPSWLAVPLRGVLQLLQETKLIATAEASCQIPSHL